MKIFFSHSRLCYAPKRLQFSYDVYKMRCQLVLLDHNHHFIRTGQISEDGSPQKKIFWSHVSRRSKKWVAYQQLQAKYYAYITGDNDSSNYYYYYYYNYLTGICQHIGNLSTHEKYVNIWVIILRDMSRKVITCIKK